MPQTQEIIMKNPTSSRVNRRQFLYGTSVSTALFWDAKEARFADHDAANALVGPPYRSGLRL